MDRRSILDSISSVSDIIQKIVEMVYEFFKRRTNRCLRIQRRIEVKDRELAMALRDGRVTDANRIAEERRDLYEKLRGCPDDPGDGQDE